MPFLGQGFRINASIILKKEWQEKIVRFLYHSTVCRCNVIDDALLTRESHVKRTKIIQWISLNNAAVQAFEMSFSN